MDLIAGGLRRARHGQTVREEIPVLGHQIDQHRLGARRARHRLYRLGRFVHVSPGRGCRNSTPGLNSPAFRALLGFNRAMCGIAGVLQRPGQTGASDDRSGRRHRVDRAVCRQRAGQRRPAEAAASVARALRAGAAGCALLASQADAAGRRHRGRRRARAGASPWRIAAAPFADRAQIALVFAAAVLLGVLGAIDDIKPIGVMPRLVLQAIAVAIMMAALPAALRIVPFFPWWLERALLFVAVPVVRQSRQLHGRHRLDDGRRGRCR